MVEPLSIAQPYSTEPLLALDASLQYSVPVAISRLQRLLDMPLDVKEAVRMFWQRQERGMFLFLYRTYFPEDYRLSQESEEIDPGWNYSPREVEFFYLTLDHLLPLLDVEYISQIGAQGERASDMIPVCPYEMPWWSEFEHLTPGWQYLRLLSGTFTLDEVNDVLPERVGLPENLLADLFVASRTMSTASPADQTRARRFFLAQDSLSAGFGRILALYQRQTGIGWLDTHPEDEIPYEGYCWCETHFEGLIQEYHAAQVYEEQANAFANELVNNMSLLRQLLTMLRQVVPNQTAAPTVKGPGRQSHART